MAIDRGCGGVGGIFNDDCAILFFIILFLLLFYDRGFGPFNC
jgi:hypothetical protein